MSTESFLKDDLVSLRSDLGLTQQQMANELHMALRSYQAIESGEASYRYIHRLAAERVALSRAVDTKQPMLAPKSIRADAIELVRLGVETKEADFIQNGTGKHYKPDLVEKDDFSFSSSYAIIGELVLIYSALDHQLNHVLIQALHLTESAMLEPVLATLDTTRKLEILKERAKHIGSAEWRSKLVSYLGKIETIGKWRNLASHNIIVPDEKSGAVFASKSAARLLKDLTPENPSNKRVPINQLTDIIKLGESALGEGQDIIFNFTRLNAVREEIERKRGKR